MTRHIDSFLEWHVGIRESLTESRYGSLPTPSEIRVLKERMARVRRSFGSDDKAAVKRIDTFFTRDDSQAAKDSLRSYLRFPDDTNRGLTEWIQKGDGADIAMFCAWNLERTLRLRNTLHHDWPTLANDVMDKTEHLVDINLLPTNALAVMDTALRSSPLLAMDSLQSGGWNAAGYYVDRDSTITLANLYENRTEMTGISLELSRVAFHEHMHAAGRNGGFSQATGPAARILQPIDEAFVEHTNVVAHAGEPSFHQIIDPARRPNVANELSSYHLERTLLGTIGVAADELAEVYFSPQASERGEWLREDLYRKIGRFFGSTERFFHFIDAYRNSPQTKRDKLLHNTINKLAQAA